MLRVSGKRKKAKLWENFFQYSANFFAKFRILLRKEVKAKWNFVKNMRWSQGGYWVSKYWFIYSGNQNPSLDVSYLDVMYWSLAQALAPTMHDIERDQINMEINIRPRSKSLLPPHTKSHELRLQVSRICISTSCTAPPPHPTKPL